MKINVPDKYADLYLKALTEKKKSLEARIEAFKKEIQDIDQHINTLTSLPIFQDSILPTTVTWDHANYRAQWTWTKKITFFEELVRKLFTSSDIVEYIVNQEPALIKGKVRSSISAALSNKSKEGHYLKFIDPVTNSTFYGTPEWFDTQGQPRLEFLPEILKQRLTA